MELKNKKSTLAALATLGVTAIAAGTTAVVKIRQKRERARKLAEIKRQKEKETYSLKLSPEQMMVYNEAVRKFITLNNRIYDLLGRCVADEAEVRDGSWQQRLAPGIYILNGRKFSKK